MDDPTAMEDDSLDLRAHALREMEKWQQRENRSRHRSFLLGLAFVVLLSFGVALWFILARPDHGMLDPGEGIIVSRGEGILEPLEPLALEPGDVVMTKPGVETRVRYGDGSVVTVGGEARFTVAGSEPDAEAVPRLDVDTGRFSANIRTRSATSPFLLTTPDARVRVLGTEFELAARPGRTRLDVENGRVEFTRLVDGTTITVAADEFAVAAHAMTNLPFRSRKVTFPGRTWKRASPAEVGLDAEALTRFSKRVGGSGVVVCGGRLVHEWGDPTKRGPGSRVTDPVRTHLLMLAITDGRIGGLDDRVDDTVPGLTTLGVARFDEPGKDATMTWRQLANHTSGYGTTEAPGETFLLDGPQTGLLADALVRDVFVTGLAEFDREILRTRLTGPMQCEHAPTLEGDPAGLLRIAPRDLARFGMLYLHEGRWNSRRILDERLAVLATSSPIGETVLPSRNESGPTLPSARTLGEPGGWDHFGSHSFGWWLNGVDRLGNRMWPSAPRDTFAALAGEATEALFVIPSLDLVIAYHGAAPREWLPGPDNSLDALLADVIAAALTGGG